MITIRFFLFVLASLSALVAGPAFAAEAFGSEADVIAIVGADVLPMTEAERLIDQTVIVRGDRIEAMGARDALPIPAGARRIDGRGMVLMPGLVDMHMHIADQPGNRGDRAARALSVLLGYGVTTARSMVGAPGHPRLRDRIEAGEVTGPRLYIGAPGIGATTIQTPDAARERVRMAAREGFDFVKLFSVADISIWDALSEEAAILNIPVSGHVSNVIGLHRALPTGMQIEHLDGTLWALLPDGSPLRETPFGQFPPDEIAFKAAKADPARISALARRVAESGSYQTPTLGLFEILADPASDPARLWAQPEMRYVPASTRDTWTQQLAQFAGLSPEGAAAFFDLRRRIVAAYHEAGVPIMAGSDSPQAFNMLGEGLLREMNALAAAGMTPMETLRSATVVPRDYFRSLPRQGSSKGWAADFGTVEPGARADLILLQGDPSADLANLRRLDTVILGGKVFDRAALDALLEEAARSAREEGAS